MTTRSVQRVVLLPRARRGFLNGIDQVAAAVRPTLGPLPRHVAVQRPHRGETPEVLDDAGLIARRIAQLADRDEDMGAMFIRQMLWRQREAHGDGAATAAVLFHALVTAGARHIAAGGNAMRLRHFLERALPLVLSCLKDQTRPLKSRARLAQLAASICPDPVLPPLLSEVYATIGRYGHLDVRQGLGPVTEREYILGAFWEGGLLSQRQVTDPKRLRGEIDNAAVLLTDFEINDPRALVPALDAAMKAGRGGLVVVARQLSAEANAFLKNASSRPEAFKAMAVKVPGTAALDQAAALEDLGVLTGGVPLLQVAGAALERVGLAHLGRAGQVWADPNHLGLLNGGGDPQTLARHVRALQSASGRAMGEPEDRHRERIGRLTGKVARLLIGGATSAESALRREQAERGARVMQGALTAGVVPGGGSALLACRPVLRAALKDAVDDDERAAYRCLLRALEQPTRTLIDNAGFESDAVIGHLRVGEAFDARTGRAGQADRAGIWDAAQVVQSAVLRAVSSAALALTVDVLVHHENPQASVEP